MSPELNQKVYDRFPFTTECGGLDIDDGWFDLLWDLCVSIERQLKKEKQDPLLPFQFTQVKQKFGSLRVYVSAASDKVYELIDEAECKSLTICESCGKMGTPNGNGWITVLCHSCRTELIGLKGG